MISYAVKDRALLVNEPEAETLKAQFGLYLEKVRRYRYYIERSGTVPPVAG